MKNTWKKVVVVVVLLGASSLSSARGAVTVYADEIPSNDAMAPAEIPANTNAAAATTHKDGKPSSDADHPPVRIDETGVHVGGPNPVDITAPNFTRHGAVATGALLTGILAILGSFGMPTGIILIIFYFKHRRNKMAHETLRAMIEKGVPITPELVAQIRDNGCSSPKDGAPRKRLLPGLVLTGVGIALLMDGHRYDNRGGWILVFIGAAFLIVWLVEGRSQNNGQPPR